MPDPHATGLLRMTGIVALSIVAACGAVTVAAAVENAPEPYDLRITGGLIHDGTGRAPVSADVLVRGDRIVRVSQVGDADARRVIDYVFVNGCLQVEGGRMTSNDCGRLLRKPNPDKQR